MVAKCSHLFIFWLWKHTTFFSLRIRVNKRIRIVGLTGDGFSGLKFELMGLAVSSDDQMDSWKGSFQWHRSMVHATCTVEIKAI